MFEQDGRPYFEEYIVDENRVKKLVLHLPIRQRENFYKINIRTFDERLFITASKDGASAEKSASDAVVDFIAEHYPYLLRKQKEFYVSKNGGLCTCGMSVDGCIRIPDDTLQMLTVSKGLYAVLEGSCYGSGKRVMNRFYLGWLRDSGFKITGAPFSVYDTSRGTNQNAIVVKSQVLMKDGTI